MKDFIPDLPPLAFALFFHFSFSPPASAVLDHSRMNPAGMSSSLHLSFHSLCCWLVSVLGSTCPQNEFTCACIRALPWLAFYPRCRRVWLMIRVCHFSQQLSRTPAFTSHFQMREKKSRILICDTNTTKENKKQTFAYMHGDTHVTT